MASQNMINPFDIHMKVVNRILQYLKRAWWQGP